MAMPQKHVIALLTYEVASTAYDPVQLR